MIDITQLARSEGVLTLAIIEDAQVAVSLAEALRAGGLGAVEIALRTEQSLAAIEQVRRHESSLTVLAGTVLSSDQAADAISRGAQGIVSPGFNSKLGAWCLGRDIPYVPGVATASEIMAALNQGHRLLKFFPAGQLGGLRLLAALQAPFAGLGVSFLMTGGMRERDLPEALAVPYVAAVGGTWIAPKAQVDAGDWESITRSARSAHNIVTGLRPEGSTP